MTKRQREDQQVRWFHDQLCGPLGGHEQQSPLAEELGLYQPARHSAGPNRKGSTMKKSDVKVGTTYRVKVSGSVQDVRITGENPHGGWNGVNVATNRSVRIKSVQRLRRVAGERPAKGKKTAPGGAGSKRPAQPPLDATSAGRPATGERRGTSRRPSGLDAAAEVLGKADGPLSAAEMVKRMLAKGLWRTNGKTPASTIYAAIIREIAAKGDKSRFRKTDRGRFDLVK